MNQELDDIKKHSKNKTELLKIKKDMLKEIKTSKTR